MVVSSVKIRSRSTKASVPKPTPKNVRSSMLRLQEKQRMLLAKVSRKTLTLLLHVKTSPEARSLQPKQLLPPLLVINPKRSPSGSYRVCNLDKLSGLLNPKEELEQEASIHPWRPVHQLTTGLTVLTVVASSLRSLVSAIYRTVKPNIKLIK